MAMDRFDRSTESFNGSRDDGNAFKGIVVCLGAELLALAVLVGAFFLVHRIFNWF